MSQAIDRARERLRWARHRIDELHDAVRAFYDHNPYSVALKPKGDEWTEITAQMLEDPPAALPFMVGDTVHNLRSILDNTVSELGRKYYREERELSFPICSNSASFSKAIANLGRLPATFRSELEAMQP